MSIDGVLSDLLEILIGVPQGSILGPILFLIYVNDLPEWSNLLALLFADDTTLLASDDNIDDLILHVNSEFKKIVTFFRAHKLSLHPEKTQFILFKKFLIQVPNKKSSPQQQLCQCMSPHHKLPHHVF